MKNLTLIIAFIIGTSFALSAQRGGGTLNTNSNTGGSDTNIRGNSNLNTNPNLGSASRDGSTKNRPGNNGYANNGRGGGRPNGHYNGGRPSGNGHNHGHNVNVVVTSRPHGHYYNGYCNYSNHTYGWRPVCVLIIGGGYIASEFAGIYAGLGVKTVQAYRGGRLLNGFDAEIRDKVGMVQENNGIDVKFNISPTEIRETSGGYIVTFDDGSKIGTDLVFMATGRKPHTSGLGLEHTDVDVDDSGAVKVDKFSKTTADNIYAVGDVTNRLNLTPVAIREGAAFVETRFKDNPTAFDHELIASAVFTRPPVGTVGMTEAEAREAHGDDITVYSTEFRPMKNALSGDRQKVFMKLITQGKKETVIGVHMVGDHSGELIQVLGICVKAGLTKEDFDTTCAVHPTISEELVTLKAR